MFCIIIIAPIYEVSLRIKNNTHLICARPCTSTEEPASPFRGTWIDGPELRRQMEAGGIHVGAVSTGKTQEAERPGRNPGNMCRWRGGPGHFTVDWSLSTHKLLVILLDV